MLLEAQIYQKIMDALFCKTCLKRKKSGCGTMITDSLIIFMNKSSIRRQIYIKNMFMSAKSTLIKRQGFGKKKKY